jgi:lysophospholipase L1-like esterase
MAWESYVALGDSFTEGMDDAYEDGRGYRGWADLVAGRLAAAHPRFRYANLAVRGRLFDRVVNEQVPAALAMKPALVSFAAGGNDALRRGFDQRALEGRLSEVVDRLRGNGADVVLFRFADATHLLPARRVIRPRLEFMNDLVQRVGDEHGAIVVDVWGDDAFLNRRLWSIDRLHLSTAGHRRVAARVLEALGVAADEAWLAPVPPPEELSWIGQRAADVRWATTHLAPWVRRRLTGRSSGDLVEPKRPTLAPMG